MAVRGADHGAVVCQGESTALHWAAMRGHVEICKLLLQHGANKTVANKMGELPIDICKPSYSSSYRFVQQLLA